MGPLDIVRIILLQTLWDGATESQTTVKKITEPASLENFQQWQKLKWIAFVTRRKRCHNKDSDIQHYFKQKLRKVTPINIGKRNN